MFKLLKRIFKIMGFIAKTVWIGLVFFIFHALIRDYIDDLIKEHRKKKEQGKMAEEILSDESLNDFEHGKASDQKDD